MIITDAWKEERPVLRGLDEAGSISMVQRGLALRKQIETILDDFWNEGFDGIWFIGIGGTYASCMQAAVFAKSRTAMPVYCENAAEFLTTGNKRFTDKAIVIFSSESGNTKEMVQLAECIKEKGARTLAFIDTPGSTLTQDGLCTHVIISRKNEQIKFFLCMSYLMYRNGDFAEYEDYWQNMEAYLPQALVQVEKESDAWARAYAEKKAEQLQKRPDLPHYFVAAGNQYGAAYSYGMCYWEEQLWIRTRVVSCPEFFHGMQEVIEKDTPVTLYIGEDEQRPLAERVTRFLPKVCANYAIIDTKEFALEGIKPQYRQFISHLVMHAVNNRVDAYLEYYLRHPMTIRRYYRQFEY